MIIVLMAGNFYIAILKILVALLSAIPCISVLLCMLGQSYMPLYWFAYICAYIAVWYFKRLGFPYQGYLASYTFTVFKMQSWQKSPNNWRLSYLGSSTPCRTTLRSVMERRAKCSHRSHSISLPDIQSRSRSRSILWHSTSPRGRKSQRDLSWHGRCASAHSWRGTHGTLMIRGCLPVFCHQAPESGERTQSGSNNTRNCNSGCFSLDVG